MLDRRREETEASKTKRNFGQNKIQGKRIQKEKIERIRPHVKEQFDYRLTKLKAKLSEFKKPISVMDTKRDKLLETLSNHPKFGAFAKLITKHMSNPESWGDWISDFQKAIYKEYELPENREKLKELDENFIVDPQIIEKVLLARPRSQVFLESFTF